MKTSLGGSAVAAVIAGSMAMARPALAANPVTVPFVYTGTEQSWQVPAGLSTVHIVVVGAHGGSTVGGATATGGFGARVEGDIHVNGGTTLYVEVGGAGVLGGSSGGGFNGGGTGGTGGIAGYGGGGASDLRPIPMGSPGSATSAIVVAGGGGGGGNDGGSGGARGGDAGSAGANGLNATGGGAGGQGVGGAGGAGSSAALNGTAGVEAIGGNGGNGVADGGGGGGGGYYGGGGGGSSTSGGGAGGGGGSSYTDAVSNLSLTTDTTGTASVTITYTPVPLPTPSPTPIPTLLSTPLPSGLVDETFTSTGGEQTWTVPDGVTSVHVILIGAPGGAEQQVSAGGHGGRVEGDLAVTPGDVLYLEVGAIGADVSGSVATPPAFNGGAAGGACNGGFWGASGGGASDIRTISRSQPGTLGSRLATAGGGGGGGDVGDGGDAGSDGNGARAGGGATTSAGGSGGTGDVAGTAGAQGSGGVGATSVACGAGGGGGVYGGGGGGASSSDVTQGGSGGGGSSSGGSLTGSTVSIDATGVPSISLVHAAAAPSGNVHVQFSVPSSAACLVLSTTAIDFGSVRLGTENAAATPDVTVTSCSGSSENLFARGSDATASGVTWNLVSGSATCADTLGTDNYRMSLESTAGTVGLSKTNASLGTLASDDTSTQTARIVAACPGSDGGGQLMTTQITFVAVDGG